MKAVIIVGGYATRLYPLTENKPKALLDLSGKLMIERIMEKVESFDNIGEAILVTNDRFYNQFLDWSKNYKGRLKVIVLNDGTKNNDDRLGALGDLEYVIKQEKIEEDILIMGGDNIFDDSLKDMAFEFDNLGFSMVAFKDVEDLEVAKSLGIGKLDGEGYILEFVEKPENPKSTLAGTLIYIIKKEDLKYISECLDLERGREFKTGEFITYLIKKEKVKGYRVKGNWFDIGNFDQLAKAISYFSER